MLVKSSTFDVYSRHGLHRKDPQIYILLQALSLFLNIDNGLLKTLEPLVLRLCDQNVGGVGIARACQSLPVVDYKTTAQFISLCKAATQSPCFLNEVVAVGSQYLHAHAGYYPALPQKQYYYRQQLARSIVGTVIISLT